MNLLAAVWNWLLRVFRRNPPARSAAATTVASSAGALSRCMIVPLLIYPQIPSDPPLDQVTSVGSDHFYTSAPWRLDEATIRAVIDFAETWLSTAVGTKIPWDTLRVVESTHTLDEWRDRRIGLLRSEVATLDLPWRRDRVYLAFVRGMGGYAGGIKYERNAAGHSMVGDICLEALAGLPEPNAGSQLLGANGRPAHSYGLEGQRGAFIHEALHGVDLPHPDGWPQGEQPDWDATIMGHWWNMPNYKGTAGLTPIEIQRVQKWLALDS